MDVPAELHISLDGQRGGLSAQIYQQVRAAVLDGRLQPGQAVPSSRELAVRLEVSRNTVTAAYDRLVAEGFLTARAGVATRVSPQVRATGGPRSPAGLRTAAPRPVWAGQPGPPQLDWERCEFDFRPGVPDARRFPYATWRGLLADAFRETVFADGYIDPAGHPGLRAAIARHVAVARGVYATPEDVLVTSGSQQAVDLVCRVLLAPGDVVAVEDPTWQQPVGLFRCLGMRVVGVPVDAEGLVVEALPDAARLVYVTPSHQFPLGVAMSLPRRLALLAWAERTGAMIVEDDYDSEFRFAGRPIEPVQSLDRAGQVVYVGSFSKTLLPGLRLGFCVSPPPLHDALRKAKFLTDWHTSLPLQVALAGLIDSGALARHVRRMRRCYQDRRDRMMTVLARDLSDLLVPVSSEAGLHLTARLLDTTVDDRVVVERAVAAGVALLALSDFGVAARRPTGVILGYGSVDAERVTPGLHRLRQVLLDLNQA